jgi:hypothetical protein
MRRLCVALLWGALCSVPAAAAAQDDGELRLMREPHSYVDVADAFDEDDPFDIRVTAGFLRRWTYGTIQRENNGAARDPNRMSRNWTDIAHHEHSQNILQLGLEVGIFRDLALYGRMPIILSDDRSLSTTSGSDPSLLNVDDTVDVDGDGMDDLMPGRTPPPLFGVPFDSPTRSGFDYVAAGLAWSIFNQNREDWLPTWVLMVEGRFNLGDPMIACSGGPQGCREWRQDPDTGNWDYTDGGSDAGETRGTNALRIETRASWRTRYVEPYAGLVFQIEWPDAADRFFLPAGNLSGFINEQPPILGQLTGGMAIIPWENRANWQRFVVDLRVMGRYVSEGHGYSPLFDALGTSNNRYLTEPNLEGPPGGADLRTVPFFGLTDMAPHAELGARIGLEMRAARLIRFQLNAALWYIQPYLITYADACNPNVDAAEFPDRQGTCRSGIINPHHRPAIDLPGQQFRVNEQVRLDLQLNVTGMF